MATLTVHSPTPHPWAPDVTHSLHSACALRSLGEDAFAWDVQDGWQQGRGAWGGLVVGSQVRAVENVLGDSERGVRTVTSQIFAPVPAEEVTIRVKLLRQGSAMSTFLTVIETAAGEPLATATVIAGLPRAEDLDTHTWAQVTAPTMPDWRNVPIAPLSPPLAPDFLGHLEVRPVQGVPATSSPAVTSGWVQPRAAEAWESWSLLAMVDAWWPASLPALPTMRPMATVNFSASLLVHPHTISVDEPLFHEGFVTGVVDGYTTEIRRLWTADGRCVVENHQSIALIK